ncbi:BZIP PROTEIN (ATBZIP48) [Salix koriyanagi]|uniref:BZIP PROTEIN (ATBZIP48) n=1 Tax=Salix koriyanagi TaxID=2511006 RepID=A0A9Q0WJY9_9ROSI|nr:BZIP PROTEIN (ATBZIP48) [Salix koriyanagi]
MLPGELTGFHYITPDQSLVPFPNNFGMMQQRSIPAFHFNRLLNNLQNSPFPQPVREFTPQSSSLSNKSTSDESEEHQLSIIDERKQRRMISNRESARRSRMRKQKHLDELWTQVVRLRNENSNLIDRLKHESECHDRVLQENARLKEEASDLRQMLTDLQIGSPYTATVLKDLEEVPCNTAHLSAESSNQSVTSSEAILFSGVLKMMEKQEIPGSGGPCLNSSVHAEPKGGPIARSSVAHDSRGDKTNGCGGAGGSDSSYK